MVFLHIILFLSHVILYVSRCGFQQQEKLILSLHHENKFNVAKRTPNPNIHTQWNFGFSPDIGIVQSPKDSGVARQYSLAKVTRYHSCTSISRGEKKKKKRTNSMLSYSPITMMPRVGNPLPTKKMMRMFVIHFYLSHSFLSHFDISSSRTKTNKLIRFWRFTVRSLKICLLHNKPSPNYFLKYIKLSNFASNLIKKSATL